MGDTHEELHKGVSSQGPRKYMIVTVNNNSGQWGHIEYFSNEDDANRWLNRE